MIPSLINYIEVLYQKKFYYGSCHDIITEQNNVLLEKATVDVDKDIQIAVVVVEVISSTC